MDLIELSWEILRYRRLKEKTLQVQRSNAIASLLQRLDGAGTPPGNASMVRSHCERAAREWSADREAASELQDRMARNGVDDTAINAEVFVQAQEVFRLFDQLMQSAQHRRIVLLSEVGYRRKFRSHSDRRATRKR